MNIVEFDGIWWNEWINYDYIWWNNNPIHSIKSTFIPQIRSHSFHKSDQNADELDEFGEGWEVVAPPPIPQIYSPKISSFVGNSLLNCWFCKLSSRAKSARILLKLRHFFPTFSTPSHPKMTPPPTGFARLLRGHLACAAFSMSRSDTSLVVHYGDYVPFVHSSFRVATLQRMLRMCARASPWLASPTPSERWGFAPIAVAVIQ